MTIGLFDAAKLARDPLVRGVLTAVATADETVSMIGFEPTAGKAISYNREKALPSVAFFGRGDPLSATQGTFDEVTVPLRSVGGDFDVEEFDVDQLSDENDQRGIQLEMKLKALGRTIGTKIITGSSVSAGTLLPAFGGVTITTVGPNQDSGVMGPGSLQTDGATDNLSYRAPGDPDYGATVNITGDGTYTLYSHNPNKWIYLTIVAGSLPATATASQITTTATKEWDGLQTLIPTTHAQAVAAIGAAGDAISFDALDAAINLVHVKDGRMAFMCNGRQRTKIMGLLRGLGGTTPEMVQLPGMTRAVPAYQGIPILRNDNIPATETKGGSGATLTSVYLVNFDGEGVSMACSQVGNAVELGTDPTVARVMGVKIQDVGPVQDKDARRTRVTFRGALKVKSELAVARIINLTA